MTTVEITYNESNTVAQKAMELLMSLGVFKIKETMSPAKKKTLKAIRDAREGKNVTRYESFDEFVNAMNDENS